MSGWKLLGLVAVLLFAALGIPVAYAAPTQVVLVKDKVALGNAKGGDAAATVSLINLTDTAVTVTATVIAPADCSVASVVGSPLPSARQSDVTITVHNCSEKKDAHVDLRVAATVGDATVATFMVTATRQVAMPDWRLLEWPFVIGAVVAAVLCAETLRRHRSGTGCTASDVVPVAKTWDFSASWGTNATLVAGAFAAVFGSADVVKAVLGDDGDALLGLVTVGVAIAAGAALAAPLVVTVSRRPKSPRLWGLLAAAGITLAGTLGELGTIGAAVWQADLGGVRYLVATLVLMGAALLLWYAISSLSTFAAKARCTPTRRERKAVSAAIGPLKIAAVRVGIGRSPTLMRPVLDFIRGDEAHIDLPDAFPDATAVADGATAIKRHLEGKPHDLPVVLDTLGLPENDRDDEEPLPAALI